LGGGSTESESKEPPIDLNRNHGRLVVPRPETPDSELAQRNIFHTDEEHERADRVLGAHLLAERRKTPAEIAAEIARLIEVDAKMEPFDFERIARGEVIAETNGHVGTNGNGSTLNGPDKRNV
jgi:hypothetical protein